jgi:hypothetical protein
MTLNQAAPAWTFAGAVGSSEPFAINGIDVWQHKWQSVEGAPRAAVRDPHYGQSYEMDVYRITDGSHSVVFAAGEFSNGIFGFYVSAGVTTGTRPPALPFVTQHIAVPGRSLVQQLAPYAPLLASVIELPWIVFTMMMFMGTRENAGPNPYWERQFSATIIIPAALGLVVGLIVLLRGDATSLLARIALAIGSVACASFVYGLGRGMFAPLQ